MTNNIDNELNALCRIVNANLDLLRRSANCRKFVFSNFTFRRFRYGRNIIYKACGEFAWFIKLTRHLNPNAIKRELLGNRIIRIALSDNSYCWLPTVGGSIENGYVIYSEIPGKTLHKRFYYGCLTPCNKMFNDTRTSFYNFGNILAELHSVKIDDPSSPKMNRISWTIFQNLIIKLNKVDNVISQIAHGIDNVSLNQGNQFLVHGNLRLDNVLFAKNKLSIIDFENCGIGSPYEDVSNICSRLILSSLAWHLPTKRIYLVLDSFLKGYMAVNDIDKNLLNNFILIRVASFYLDNLDKTPKISKLPISKRHLKYLCLHLLDQNYQTAIPGYQFTG